MTSLRETRKSMLLMYGKNTKITDDNYIKNLAITCKNGVFVGEKDGDVVSYKGIPFALAPVGHLRWKAPLAAPASNDIYEAKYFGPSPIQKELASERASLYIQSEDCLYLNIWLNSLNKSTKKPVLVFIHGGSYGWGGTSDPLYDGTNLIKKFDDIILVTIAYRTGIMGFMDFSSVEGGNDFEDSSNLGLLDQIEALKWIKENISSFGGDPDNVTIAGESAGGGSVSLLPLISEAKGLFQKVIAESGSVALTYSKDEVQELTKKLLDYTNSKSMNDLMNLSEDEIMEVNKKLNDYNNFPLRGSKLLPENLYKAYESGVAKDIKILSGTNKDESRYWINEVGGILQYTVSIPVLFENNMKRVSNDDAELVGSFLSLRDESRTWKLTEFYNELLFRIPAIEQSEIHTNSGGVDYMYYFEYPSGIPNMGACHAVELAYVFNNLNETIYNGDNINFDIADKLQNMWVNFVRNGDPSTNDITWPKYDTKTRSTMVFGDDAYILNDPLQKQRELLTPLLKYNFNGCYTNLDLNVPFAKKIKTWLIIIIAFIVILLLLIFLFIK